MNQDSNNFDMGNNDVPNNQSFDNNTYNQQSLDNNINQEQTNPIPEQIHNNISNGFDNNQNINQLNNQNQKTNPIPEQIQNNVNNGSDDNPNYDQTLNNITQQSELPIGDSNLNNSQETNKHKKRNTGRIIGIAIGVLVVLYSAARFITSFFGDTNTGSNVFYSDGYDLSYGLGWTKSSVATTDNEKKDALIFGRDDVFLIPLGTSALSEFESQYNMDFETDNGKKKMYDEFYYLWNTEDRKILNGSNGFNLLTDDIYYATMDYGLSANQIRGKYYLLVNVDHNIIISLMSNMTDNFDKNHERVLNILKTINIEKQYDNDIADLLDSMSAWNKYSNLRQGTLGTKKNINGEWKTLSDSEAYWVFKNGNFWWYKSFNDLNDNYWYGNTRILTGKSGLKEIGLDESRVDYIVANAGGTVTSESIYTIIFTPSKIISDGVDKSSTNISGENWHMVWIIVDHGSDGLEAQMLNVKTYETTYLVKLKD